MANLSIERLILDSSESSIEIKTAGGQALAIDGSGYVTANINGTVTVDATDLDIRDLTHVSDSVKIGDGTETANVNASNELQVRDDDANTLLGTIDADTSTLAGAVSGSEMQVDVVAALPAGDNNIGNVDIASALPAGDNNIGNVDVVDLPGIENEDAAASGGEQGMFMLGIRQDAGGSPVSADGDFHPFVFNDDGELKVAADLTSSVADDAADSGNPIKVGSKAHDGAAALGEIADADRANLLSDSYRRIYINDAPNVSASASAASVTDSEVLLGTAISGRTRILIQNNSNNPIFVGPTGVSVSTGLEVSKNSTLSLELGESIDLYGIASTGTNDVRILQLA